jgi:hypothetical protein
MGADRTRVLRGALAGAVAAGVWAVQQPLDKRVFGVDYDDAELLGTVITQRRGTAASLLLGSVLHIGNGALFGAGYALVARSLPGAPPVRGIAAGMTEHLGTWPLTRFLHLHPVDGDFPQLWGNHRAFAQATWRHVLFGAVLGTVEQRLNPPDDAPASGSDGHAASNGHGDVAHLVTARTV